MIRNSEERDTQRSMRAAGLVLERRGEGKPGDTGQQQGSWVAHGLAEPNRGFPSVRALEPQPGESSKAFAAYKVYRDLGFQRSLAKAAEIYYGSIKNLSQMGVWSRRFDWVQRARSYDDWLEMHARAAVEEHQQTKAVEFAQRQMALKEKLLKNAEEAAEQAAKILAWPLTEQRIVREGEDGRQITYVFTPAGWSKATARALHDMAVGAVVGTWTVAKRQGDDESGDFDFSEFSDAELKAYIRLDEKIGNRKRARSQSARAE